jgi:hypothetical protein
LCYSLHQIIKHATECERKQALNKPATPYHIPPSPDPITGMHPPGLDLDAIAAAVDVQVAQFNLAQAQSQFTQSTSMKRAKGSMVTLQTDGQTQGNHHYFQQISKHI